MSDVVVVSNKPVVTITRDSQYIIYDFETYFLGNCQFKRMTFGSKESTWNLKADLIPAKYKFKLSVNESELTARKRELIVLKHIGRYESSEV